MQTKVAYGQAVHWWLLWADMWAKLLSASATMFPNQKKEDLKE